jgi:hypothetical protein
VEQCPLCSQRFPIGAKYCGGCGNALPWTETGLAAAREYIEGLDIFSQEEKSELNASLKDLTADSAATPLAASRLRRAVSRAGSVVGAALVDIAKAVATSEAKKHLGL